MTPFRSEFSAHDLYTGSVAATIAHAVWTARHPELSHEQTWDGPTYCVQNTAGALGAVTFAAEGTIGAFFDVRSPQQETFRPGGPSEHLAGAPDHLVALGQREALQYMLQTRSGTTAPVLSAAFWTDDDAIASAAPWPVVMANGAHLVRLQLQGAAAALPHLAERYSLDAERLDLVRELVDEKLAAANDTVLLTHPTMRRLRQLGSNGLEQTLQILAGLGLTRS